MRISEKQFLGQVVGLAELCGFRCYHTWNSRRSQAGFPDLVLVKPGRPVIFAELKSDTGKTTAEQDEWLAALKAAGAKVYLWRPDDLQAIADLLGG